ncbi:DDE-type integrase/transposase/recombinase [Leptolyngbya sp. GB1-A1]
MVRSVSDCWIETWVASVDGLHGPLSHPANANNRDSLTVLDVFSFSPSNKRGIKVRGAWKYLYRAVDSKGNTLDFMLSAKRDAKAAARFFRKVLKGQQTQVPRVITVYKNAAYSAAIETLKADELIDPETQLRQSKYLNSRP